MVVSRLSVWVKRSVTVRVLFLSEGESGAKEDCPSMDLNDGDSESGCTVGAVSFFFFCDSIRENFNF